MRRRMRVPGALPSVSTPSLTRWVDPQPGASRSGESLVNVLANSGREMAASSGQRVLPAPAPPPGWQAVPVATCPPGALHLPGKLVNAPCCLATVTSRIIPGYS